MRADVLPWPMVSCRLAAPDEDMQSSSDNGSSSPLLMERVQPGAAFEFGNRTRLDGHLRAAVSHAGIEALQISFKGKEAARPDVHDAGALKEQWQLPH